MLAYITACIIVALHVHCENKVRFARAEQLYVRQWSTEQRADIADTNTG